MIRSTQDNLETDVFDNTKLTADSGFHTMRNMDMLAEEGIDAYVADNLFRKRDPRFDHYGRYKKQVQSTGKIKGELPMAIVLCCP